MSCWKSAAVVRGGSELTEPYLHSQQAVVVYASAGAVELTAANHKELVEDSGKSAFVKFFAPWYPLHSQPLTLHFLPLNLRT